MALVQRLRDGALATADYREALVVQRLPLALDPLAGGGDPAAADVGHLLYRGLLRFDASNYPVPDLASQFTVSPDGTTFHVTLAKGLQWSDGHPLTVADVLTTVAFAQSPQAATWPGAPQWKGVVLKVNGTTIDFTLPSPRASFQTALAQLPILPIGGTTAFGGLVTSSGAILPTSGPYRVTVAGSDALRLEPNPFAGSSGRIHVVVFRLYTDFGVAANALKSGDVDGLLATTPAERSRLSTMHGVTMHDIATDRFCDLLLDKATPGLSDPAVRAAIAGVIDRAALITDTLNGAGVAQTGPIPEGIAWAASVDPHSARVQTAAAGAALDSAGWTMGSDGVRSHGGVRLAFGLSVSDVAPLPAVAAALAAQLRPLGIAVTVAPLDQSHFMTTVTTPGAFQLAVADWESGPDPDVSLFWRSTAVPPKGEAVSGGTADPFLDKNLDNLATLDDKGARLTAANHVATQLAEDVPAVFLYTPSVSLALSSRFSGATVPLTGDAEARWASLPSWRRG